MITKDIKTIKEHTELCGQQQMFETKPEYVLLLQIC